MASGGADSVGGLLRSGDQARCLWGGDYELRKEG